MSNKRLEMILRNRGGQLEDCDLLDCYNQAICRGISCTITTGINYRCMHYVVEIVYSASNKEGMD